MKKRKIELSKKLKRQVKSNKIEKEDITTRIKRSGIKTKLIGAFLIPVIFIVLLGTVSYIRSSKSINTTYIQATKTSLEMVSGYLELAMDGVYGKANQLNSDSTVNGYYTGKFANDSKTEKNSQREIINSIKQLSATDKFIYAIHLFGQNGSAVSSTSTGSLGKEWYAEFEESEDGRRFLSSGEKIGWVGTHAYIDQKKAVKNTDYCLSMIREILNKKNQRAGYIIIDVKTDFVKETLSNMNLPKGSVVGFVTGDGREVLVGEYSKEFSFLNETYFEKVSANKENYGNQFVKHNGKSFLFQYTKLTRGDIVVCSIIPESVINKQSEALKGLTIIVVLLAAAIAIIVGTGIASGIGKTIHATNRVLKEVADGNLAVDIKVNRKDEFAILAKGILTMLENMKMLIRKMTGVSKTISSSSSNVALNSQILLEATRNISRSVADMEMAINQQAEDSGNCLEQMTHLSRQVNTVSENAEEIGYIAKDAKLIVDEGIVVVEDLSRKVDDTNKITEGIVGVIKELEVDSRSIDGIVDTINAIAEQTNLLSLNASIEAARAGVAGRGFAVVADEIRKLADQSKEASDQIKLIIDKIQKQTSNASMVAGKADAFVALQEKALQSTIYAFHNIDSKVENLVEKLENIGDGIKGIESAKENTLGAVESMSATAEESAAAIGELSNTTEKQIAAVEELNEAANLLKEDSENLESTVLIFRVE